ncbi:MAG TPA: phosphoglycerate dehydrogenase [Gaiellaceae bacterium]|nr:phosphoglycerate dehydrogenase [Gaiellaceae bacterium]
MLRAELLERYHNVRFNDEGKSLAGKELVAFLQGCVKAITALERIDESLLAQLPELEVISKVGVGVDMIDLDALDRHHVRLSWSRGTNSRSVAELVVAFAISLLRGVVAANEEVRSGVWRQQVGRTLSGCTVGLIGFGSVGRDVARLLQPFGCTVLCTDAYDVSEHCAELGVTPVELDELLRRSDVVSLHLDLNDGSRNILDGERLKLLPLGAIVINTSRGHLVDEGALKAMLMSGRLAGAAFDVFASEPPEDRELLNLPNFLATPHIGGSTEEAILAMGRAAIAGLDASPSSPAPADLAAGSR